MRCSLRDDKGGHKDALLYSRTFSIFCPLPAAVTVFVAADEPISILLLVAFLRAVLLAVSVASVVVPVVLLGAKVFALQSVFLSHRHPVAVADIERGIAVVRATAQMDAVVGITIAILVFPRVGS